MRVFRKLLIFFSVTLAVIINVTWENIFANELASTAKFTELSQQLVKLQLELTKVESPLLERFLENAVSENYPPASYIKLMRDKEMSSSEADQLITKSFRGGVINATFVIGDITEGYYSGQLGKLHEISDNELVLKNLNQFGELDFRGLILKWSAQKRIAELNGGSADSSDLNAGILLAAERGSNLAAGYLLKQQGLDEQTKSFLCAVLLTNHLAQKISGCEGYPKDAQINLESLSTNFGEHRLKIYSSINHHGYLPFFVKGLCSKVDKKSGYDGVSICNDLLEIAAFVCILRSEKKELLPINGLSACNDEGLAKITTLVNDSYRSVFGFSAFVEQVK